MIVVEGETDQYITRRPATLILQFAMVWIHVRSLIRTEEEEPITASDPIQKGHIQHLLGYLPPNPVENCVNLIVSNISKKRNYHFLFILLKMPIYISWRQDLPSYFHLVCYFILQRIRILAKPIDFPSSQSFVGCSPFPENDAHCFSIIKEGK